MDLHHEVIQMSEFDDQRDEELDDSSSRALWLKTGIAGALGFELLGFVLAGVLIGTQIDARYDSSPVGLLATMSLALLAAGWHIYLVGRRYLVDREE